MAKYKNREAFIPYRRTDLIEMCLNDGKLQTEEKKKKFKSFCEILAAYYHFEFHESLEKLKDFFAPFNPDSDTKSLHPPSPIQLKAMESQLIDTFEEVLQYANYVPLSQERLDQALKERTLIDLETKVNFDDFRQMVFYHRGEDKETVTTKQFYIRKITREIEVFERVVLLLKFKEANYFENKDKNIEDLNFTPGKTYIYLYKNIPKHDLELLFPNVEISMTWKDRILFGVPAVGAAIPVLLRISTQLLIILGVILFFTLGPDMTRELTGTSEEQVENILPALLALVTVAMALGGFAFKQYNSYKNKQIKFLKDVTDTLFFRMLDSNGGVLRALIDSAEEEETKEIILVYYHLLTHEEPLTAEQLDDKIEAWMEANFKIKIDFDIDGPLKRLEHLKGKISQEEPAIPLLRRDENEKLHLLSLEESQQVIDYVWDNLFLYNNL